MDIDADQLGIPDTEYDARVTMPSSEFSRICRDLSQLGESVRIEVSKEGVRFASDGEAANGSVLLKQTEAARRKYADYGKKVKREDDEEGSSKKAKVKKEEGSDAEMGDGEDVEEDDGGAKEDGNDDGEEEKENGDESDEESENRRKRKRAEAKVCAGNFVAICPTHDLCQANGKSSKRAKKTSSADDDGATGGVSIEMNQHVQLTFSLKYLVNFAKSQSLSDTVQLMMSNDVPLLVSTSLVNAFL